MSTGSLAFTESVLARVAARCQPQDCPLSMVRERNIRDVQKSILILVLFVDAAHESGRGGQDLIDENKDGLLRAKLDALADHVDKLAYCQVGRDQVLLLIDGGNVRLFHLLADYLQKVSGRSRRTGGRMAYRNAISVLLANAFGFRLPLLEGVLVLEFGAHCDQIVRVRRSYSV